MCLSQGPQRSGAGKARSRVQHSTTALQLSMKFQLLIKGKMVKNKDYLDLKLSGISSCE